MARAAGRSSGSPRAEKSAAAFRTISEVSEQLDIPQHVLRFWESKFAQIRPMKRGGGRRYYRPEDIALLRTIRDHLYTEGYTIRGVQKLLREGGAKSLGGVGERHFDATPETDASRTSLSADQRATLQATLDELVVLRGLLP